MLLLLWLYFTSPPSSSSDTTRTCRDFKTDTESTVIQWNLWEKNKKQKSLCNVNSLFFTHMLLSDRYSCLHRLTLIKKDRNLFLWSTFVWIVWICLYLWISNMPDELMMLFKSEKDWLSLHSSHFLSLWLLFTKFSYPSPVNVLNQAETFKGQFVLLTAFYTGYSFNSFFTPFHFITRIKMQSRARERREKGREDVNQVAMKGKKWFQVQPKPKGILMIDCLPLIFLFLYSLFIPFRVKSFCSSYFSRIDLWSARDTLRYNEFHHHPFYHPRVWLQTFFLFPITS